MDRSKGEASLLVWDTNHFSGKLCFVELSCTCIMVYHVLEDFNAKHLFSSQITRDTLSCVSRPLTEFGMVRKCFCCVYLVVVCLFICVCVCVCVCVRVMFVNNVMPDFNFITCSGVVTYPGFTLKHSSVA